MSSRREIEFRHVDEALVRQACDVLDLLKRKRLAVVTAGSCTSGLLAAVLSDAPGAGGRLHGGFVTCTSQNKTAALGVPADLKREFSDVGRGPCRYGAVAEAMRLIERAANSIDSASADRRDHR